MRVNRSPDTIKRWVDEGLLECGRDERNWRQFSEASVERCLILVRLSVAAQLRNRKLAELVAEIPEQLAFITASGQAAFAQIPPEANPGKGSGLKAVSSS